MTHQKQITKLTTSSQSDVRLTPPSLLHSVVYPTLCDSDNDADFIVDLDPCAESACAESDWSRNVNARYFKTERDPITAANYPSIFEQNSIETCFCNPPFSKTSLFLEMLAYAAKNHGVSSLALVKADFRTNWWNDYIWKPAEAQAIYFPRYTRFLRIDGTEFPAAPFSIALVLYTPLKSDDRVIDRFYKVTDDLPGRMLLL